MSSHHLTKIFRLVFLPHILCAAMPLIASAQYVSDLHILSKNYDHRLMAAIDRYGRHDGFTEIKRRILRDLGLYQGAMVYQALLSRTLLQPLVTDPADLNRVPRSYCAPVMLEELRRSKQS